jgi:hypothetical protein
VKAVVIHCPALGRDLSELKAKVPDLLVYEATIQPGGCCIAHQAVVAMAAAEGWPNVWVLEDDCVLLPTWSRERWEADVAWAAANGYGVVTGAVATTLRPKRTGRDGLVAVDQFRSAHCIAYNAQAYPIAAAMREPLDVQLGDLGAKPVVTLPFVAHQRPGLSANTGRVEDYTHHYVNHEAFLRRVTQRQRR